MCCSEFLYVQLDPHAHISFAPQTAGSCARQPQAALVQAIAGSFTITGFPITLRGTLQVELRGAKDKAQDEEQSTVSLTITRLTSDEMGYFLLPIVGKLGVIGANEIAMAPTANASGPFGTFNVREGGQEWVVMPPWVLLLQAESPVAVSIPNCADVPAIAAISTARVRGDCAGGDSDHMHVFQGRL